MACFPKGEVMYSESQVRRFWSKVDKSGGPNACWRWTGALGRNGYGYISVNGKDRTAHRVGWEIENGGEMPSELHACHTCDHTWCVNPSHIWAGTRHENMRDARDKGRLRMPSDPGWRKRLTHCKHGHEFTPENTRFRLDQGARECLTCKKTRDAERSKKRKEAA